MYLETFLTVFLYYTGFATFVSFLNNNADVAVKYLSGLIRNTIKAISDFAKIICNSNYSKLTTNSDIENAYKNKGVSRKFIFNMDNSSSGDSLGANNQSYGSSSNGRGVTSNDDNQLTLNERLALMYRDQNTPATPSMNNIRSASSTPRPTLGNIMETAVQVLAQAL